MFFLFLISNINNFFYYKINKETVTNFFFNIFTFLKILKDQKVKCINYTNYNIDQILVFTFGSFSLDTFIVKHDKPTTFIVFRIFNLISFPEKCQTAFSTQNTY